MKEKEKEEEAVSKKKGKKNLTRGRKIDSLLPHRKGEKREENDLFFPFYRKRKRGICPLHFRGIGEAI